MQAVVKDYAMSIDVMEEINVITHDDNGLRECAVLVALEKFDTLMVEVWPSCFGAAEEVSKCYRQRILHCTKL